MTRTHKKRYGGQLQTSISDSVQNYGEKAKQGLSNLGNSVSDFFSKLGKSSTGGKKNKSRKNRRGGNMIKSFNSFFDKSTYTTTPVSGYNKLMPVNYVGGKHSKKHIKRKGGLSRKKKDVRGILP